MARHVLVVDDEPDIREIARLALEQLAGWVVTEASSGAQALELAASEHPDAVLLDVMMPGMDGPETARRLRENDATKDLAVLLLTAKVLSRDRDDLAAAPVDGVLGKPFDPLTLAGDIERALGWGR